MSPSLSQRERDDIRLALERDFPVLGARFETAELEVVPQRWFSRVRVVAVNSALPFPGVGGHVALLPSGVRVLSGHFENIAALLAVERPSLRTELEARAYALRMDDWARDGDWPQMMVESFADLPFRDEATTAQIASLEARLASRIHPLESAETPSGWRFTVWVLSNGRLLERRLDVGRDGSLARQDRGAEPLPVHSGRAWGFVNERLVPVA